MHRRIVLMLLLLVAVVGVGAWVASRPPVPVEDVEEVDEFEVVRKRLRTFETAYLEAHHDGGRFAVQISSTGRVAMDSLSRGQYRYVWTGGELWIVEEPGGRDICPPMLRVAAPPQVAELWAEVRSGFASSIVTETLPSEPGSRYFWTSRAGGTSVVMIRLPFEWAKDRRIFLEYSRWNGMPKALLVTDLQDRALPSPLPIRSPIAAFSFLFETGLSEWDAPLDPGIFRTSFADVRSAAYEGCRRDRGHRHGPWLREEHSAAEIHGQGLPRHEGVWDPSCDVGMPPLTQVPDWMYADR